MPANRPIQTLEVPGYSGKGVRVAAGSLIQVTDVQGTQIGDVFAVSEKEHSEFLSPSVTRAVLSRLFPKVGEVFWTNAHRPVLTFVEDCSPGIHDMLFSCCDRQLFEALGVEGHHANCRDNYLAVATEIGIGHGIVPDPVNIFQNTPVESNAELSVHMTPSRPGDSVTFRAEMDLFFILTACSCDIALNNINGGVSTPLRIDIFEAES